MGRGIRLRLLTAVAIAAVASAGVFVAPPPIANAGQAQGQAAPALGGGTVRGPAGSVLTAGMANACIVGFDGAVTCWGGDNAYGENTPPTNHRYLSVSSRYRTTCGVRFGYGTAECWGYTAGGEGAVPSDLFESVVVGLGFACGIRTDGTIKCWGTYATVTGAAGIPAGTFTALTAGYDFVCGLRTSGTLVCWGDTSDGIVSVPSGTFTAVSAGAAHACAIKTDGTAACWGYNLFGQATAASGTFKALTGGLYHSCGIKTDGTLACWGSNSSGQASAPAGTYTNIAAGYLHNCARKTDGTLACWGNNTNGELNGIPSGTFPVSVGRAISGGQFHTCAIGLSGDVGCWGNNGHGEATPPTGKFIGIATGGSFSCGVRVDGTLACWGDTAYGETTPPSGTFTSVTAGISHACGIRTDGTEACWGYNTYGQTAPQIGTFIALDAGYHFTCGIKTGGSLVCWGRNGDNETTIPLGTDTYVGLSSGYVNSCAIKTDGTLACWGRNPYGLPLPPPAGTYVAISNGFYHACAIATNSHVTCWGDNGYGQATAPSDTMIAITTGDNHSCGVTTEGRTTCWGRNLEGESLPVFGPAPLTAPEGVPYHFALAIGTGISPAPAFSVVSGSLPPGLMVATSGVITGTPTTLGTYSVTFAAYNGIAPAVSMTYDLVVGPSAVRYAGTDRYKTAVDVSQKTFPSGASTVYIAYSMNFPDALAGAAAAGTVKGPVLLTDTASLNPDTAAELTRLHPAKIIILGSTGVISAAVETALHGFGATTVSRYWGWDRYKTAVDVSQKTFPSGASTVYLAYSMNFPDALAGAAAAGTIPGPVLLTDTASLNPDTAAELGRLHPAKIVVLGSAGVISNAVLTAAASYAPAVVRYSGADRYATAVDVSQKTFTTPGVPVAYIAYSMNFPDALAGAAAAGTVAGPVLLTSTAGPIDSGTAAELTRLRPHKIVVLGSAAVVSDTVLNSLKAYAVP